MLLGLEKKGYRSAVQQEQHITDVMSSPRGGDIIGLDYYRGTGGLECSTLESAAI